MGNQVSDSAEFKRFFKNVASLVDRKTAAKAIAKSKAGKEIINVVIGQARIGLGPDMTPYAPYSPEYAKRKAAAGQKGAPFWLRGVGNTGRNGGMLDPKNFSYEVRGAGDLFLVWKPVVDAKIGDYAGVHQEGNDTTPQRKWMHLKSVAAATAVVKVFTTVYKQLVAKIASGGKI